MNEKMDIRKFKELAENFKAKRKNTTILGHVQYDFNDLAYRTSFETKEGKRVSDEELLKEMGITFLRMPGQAGVDYITSGKSYDLLIIDKHSHKCLKIGESYTEEKPYIVGISRNQNPQTPIIAYWDGFVNEIPRVNLVRDVDPLHFRPCITEIVRLADEWIHKIEDEKIYWELGDFLTKPVKSEHIFTE